MATIIFSGRLTADAKVIVNSFQNGMTTFTVAENLPKDQTNFFDCIGKLSDEQRKYLTKGKYVEIVGQFSTKVNEKDGKKYYNTSTYVDRLIFPTSVSECPSTSK
ncbi:MAG: single-stranded DNA-binding protein [Bacteroidales bacterium]|jgi:single-stranded DNA-binding protein|nr:single-stranded DNA-binding protein [Bacteroidales bacterium]